MLRSSSIFFLHLLFEVDLIFIFGLCSFFVGGDCAVYLSASMILKKKGKFFQFWSLDPRFLALCVLSLGLRQLNSLGGGGSP